MKKKNERVVLVNYQDKELGTMEKLEAHRKGVLHRAISLFLFNSRGEMLLQQRSAIKYHSPLLWTNACCSHPRPNESYQSAIQRRLFEELGIHTQLHLKFHFIYKINVGNNLIEHELDHVFIGFYNGLIPFNSKEVAKIKWISNEELKKQIQTKSEVFTAWFKIILNEYSRYFY